MIGWITVTVSITLVTAAGNAVDAHLGHLLGRRSVPVTLAKYLELVTVATNYYSAPPLVTL